MTDHIEDNINDDVDGGDDDGEDPFCCNHAPEQSSVFVKTVRLHRQAVARRLEDHEDEVSDPTGDDSENSQE